MDETGRILMKSALAEADKMDAFLSFYLSIGSTSSADPRNGRPAGPRREGRDAELFRLPFPRCALDRGNPSPVLIVLY